MEIIIIITIIIIIITIITIITIFLIEWKYFNAEPKFGPKLITR